VAPHHLDNYLKTYRRQSGLTQAEVAFLLGWKNGEQFSRYEKRHRLPPLRTAIACEAIFKVPVAALFAGVKESVDREILDKIEKLNAELEQKKAQGKRDRCTAKKLCWLAEHHGNETFQHI
jgi:transcriptional regulator with XRE-family HTH domain